MGTNYTWRDTPCGSCGRYDEMHVGKSSGGWSFGFRGYRHSPDDDVYSPFGMPVMSRADWLMVFTTRAGTLTDEYGRQVADPVAWLSALGAPSVEQRRREDSREMRGPHAGWLGDREWRDAEGFRFYDGEFS